MIQKWLPFVFLLCSGSLLLAQEEEQKPFTVDASYFYGTILEHNPDINHLITGHPTGLILSYNRRTYGFNAWERRYNFPDWGFSMTYQNMHNEYLGENVGLYGHFNFYFLKRNAYFRIGQGIAYTSNPYDRETNYINNAYGTRLLSSTYIALQYDKKNIIGGLGLNAGFTIIHYSNANLRAPNNSTNTLGFTAGINYNREHDNFPELITTPDTTDYSQPIKFNLAIRAGVNESDIVGQGRFPFYNFSAFADKRIGAKSTIVGGVDVFFGTFLKELIKLQAASFPELGVSGDEDWKRVGIFLGHELRFNKMAFVSHLGYYVYWPYEFENRLYNRLGLKRYFTENISAAVTVKAHGAKAEGVEFGLGYRF
ncbi:MAG: acyloxyacyl hydrolase [Leeuwenhoekiella sp.]